MRQGFEPDRGSFSNSVTACDFWSDGFISNSLPTVFHSPGVYWCPLESTPVVERIRRATKEDRNKLLGAGC